MKNEPVAWMSIQEGIFSPSFKYLFSETEKQGFIPLYTHPVKELTDEEIEEVAQALIDDCAYCSLHFARAILRKAQEK
jgi:hypothetical protein